MRDLALAVFAASVGTACSHAGAYECSSSVQCIVDSIAGECQPDGWCSFPDGDCPSGQRYGELAGDGLAGDCVSQDLGTDGTGDPATSTTNGATLTTTPGETDDEVTSTEPDLGGADPLCGNGSVDGEEQCDDGDEMNEDECTNACTLPACGDGIMQVGEACDDGLDNGDARTCTTHCALAKCGDGLLHEGVEQCDGDDLGGLDCTSLGLPDPGDPTCTPECTLDPTSCFPCQMMGRICGSFGPCDGMCEDGSECYSPDMMEGTCLPSCMGDEACSDVAPTWPTYCAMTSVCVIDCQITNNCPDGMTCSMTPLGVICVW